MSEACTSGSFTYRNGVLGLADTGGSWVLVGDLYQPSQNDGAFSQLGSPGRTHNDINLAWVNDTGVPQNVWAEIERGPRLVIQSSPAYFFFREKATFATGPNVSAPEPDTTSEPSGFTAIAFSSACAFFTSNKPVTVYTAQDRSRMHAGMLRCEPGDTANVRFRVQFGNITPLASAYNYYNAPKYESRARWARARLYAAPCGI